MSRDAIRDVPRPDAKKPDAFMSPSSLTSKASHIPIPASFNPRPLGTVARHPPRETWQLKSLATRLDDEIVLAQPFTYISCHVSGYTRGSELSIYTINTSPPSRPDRHTFTRSLSPCCTWTLSDDGVPQAPHHSSGGIPHFRTHGMWIA